MVHLCFAVHVQTLWLPSLAMTTTLTLEESPSTLQLISKRFCPSTPEAPRYMYIRVHTMYNAWYIFRWGKGEGGAPPSPLSLALGVLPPHEHNPRNMHSSASLEHAWLDRVCLRIARNLPFQYIIIISVRLHLSIMHNNYYTFT